MAGKKAQFAFRKYAKLYDAFYQDKDYESECNFLEEIFSLFGKDETRNILDLGCGTGGHAIPLAHRGYHVVGVDCSAQMLSIARQKLADKDLSANLKFKKADIQNLSLDLKFDAVIGMFAVLSYQTSNAGLLSTITSARRQINRGGLFICDFWYGPAVLKQRPAERAKIIRRGRDRLVRLVQPETDFENNIVHVQYEIFSICADRLIEESQEKHSMRYFFKPEIELCLNQTGFHLEHFSAFADLESKASEETWNAVFISRAI